MSFLGYLLLAIAKVLELLIDLYTFIVLVAVLLSWVRPDPDNPLVRILRQLTEPVFYQIRKRLPSSLFRFGIDITPILVLVLLVFVETLVVNSLYEAAQHFLR